MSRLRPSSTATTSGSPERRSAAGLARVGIRPARARGKAPRLAHGRPRGSRRLRPLPRVRGDGALASAAGRDGALLSSRSRSGARRPERDRRGGVQATLEGGGPQGPRPRDRADPPLCRPAGARQGLCHRRSRRSRGSATPTPGSSSSGAGLSRRCSRQTARRAGVSEPCRLPRLRSRARRWSTTSAPQTSFSSRPSGTRRRRSSRSRRWRRRCRSSPPPSAAGPS